MSRTLSPFIVFDRDGTLIEDKIFLNDVRELVYLPGVFVALKALRDLGFKFVVATNQSGMATGKVSLQQITDIHNKMRNDLAAEGLAIEAFYYAPFTVESNHPMRKPNAGMLELAISDWGIDVSKSYMIGDRETDVAAGKKIGLKTVLLSSAPYDATRTETSLIPDFTCKDLNAFVFSAFGLSKP